jgi:hypothetical protein
MTEQEAYALAFDRDNPVSKAMFRFRTEYARMEQKFEQSKRPTPAAIALLEYNAVKAIVSTLGLSLPRKGD